MASSPVFAQTTFPVLDHGFVRIVDTMGDDAAIAQAARVSYGNDGEARTAEEDEKLIRYLVSHRHTSPVEFAEITLHIKAPIFVARQWFRHRTGNFCELSGRYAEMKEEFYVPTAGNVREQSATNKQGSGLGLDDVHIRDAQESIEYSSTRSFETYGHVLSDDGVARETSRIVLPLNTYTEWYWKIDLHNLLHFLELRCDEHAQWEIRQYADVILDKIVKPWVPATYRAFVEYRKDAHTLSSTAFAVLRRMLAGGIVNRTLCGLTKREWEEMIEPLLKS